MKQAPDAPILPPRDSLMNHREASPPPLPPRREPGSSPGSHPHSHHLSSLPMGHGSLPRLNPTHFSQLYIRRQTTLHPRTVRDIQQHNASPRWVN